MKRLAFAKYGYYFMSIFFYIFGVAYMFMPDLPSFWLCMVCGVILLLYGCIKLVGYLSPDLYQLAFQYDMASAILFMILGFLVLVFNVHVRDFFIPGFGLLILFDSVLTIQTAKDAAKFGMKSWVLLLVVSILTALCGVVLLVVPFPGLRARHIAVGISILMEGIMKHCVVLCTVKGTRKSHRDDISGNHAGMPGQDQNTVRGTGRA